MTDRLQRLEFVTLYELYLRKNDEFRQAVNDHRDPNELNGLRESMSQIYRRLSEKRGFVHPEPRQVSNIE